MFKYLVCYGGGEGPDVWDKEVEVDAEDMLDASRQAKGLAEDEYGWVFSIQQNDYPPTKREELERRLREVRLEIDGYIDGAPDRSEAASLANRIAAILAGYP